MVAFLKTGSFMNEALEIIVVVWSSMDESGK